MPTCCKGARGRESALDHPPRFLIELALYLPQAPTCGYWVFLFHVSLAMELVLLAPLMKFSHAVYRPVALFFYALGPGHPDVPGRSA